jgi:hypothetical protein
LGKILPPRWGERARKAMVSGEKERKRRKGKKGMEGGDKGMEKEGRERLER